MIVDESSSMGGKEQEVMDGYNAFLNEQLRIKEDANLSLIKFGSYVSTVYSNIQLQSVPMLDRNSYRPAAMTALFDAIGDGIRLIDTYKRSEDRAIVVIITDGGENASTRYTEQQVKQMIADRTARGDWSFIYIGECAQQFAAKMGISAKNAINFCHEKGKIKANFEAASVACSALRSNKMKASDALLNN